MAHECLIVLCKRKLVQIPREKSHAQISPTFQSAASTAYLSRLITHAAFATVLWIIWVLALLPDLPSDNYCCCALVLKSTCDERHHTFGTFAKSQQYVERYTEIKVSDRSSLPAFQLAFRRTRFCRMTLLHSFNILVMPTFLLRLLLHTVDIESH